MMRHVTQIALMDDPAARRESAAFFADVLDVIGDHDTASLMRRLLKHDIDTLGPVAPVLLLVPGGDC